MKNTLTLVLLVIAVVNLITIGLVFVMISESLDAVYQLTFSLLLTASQIVSLIAVLVAYSWYANRKDKIKIKETKTQKISL